MPAQARASRRLPMQSGARSCSPAESGMLSRDDAVLVDVDNERLPSLGDARDSLRRRIEATLCFIVGGGRTVLAHHPAPHPFHVPRTFPLHPPRPALPPP